MVPSAFPDADVRLTFTVPEGWENNGWGVGTSDSDPGAGVIIDRSPTSSPIRANRWSSTHPGPTVDDLVAAFASVPDLNATEATDVTVDGFHGKEIEFTVPDYNEDECNEGHFALFQRVMLGPGRRVPATGRRPNALPSTVDPRHRRHPPGDRRDVGSRTPPSRTATTSTRSSTRSRSTPSRPSRPARTTRSKRPPASVTSSA